MRPKSSRPMNDLIKLSHRTRHWFMNSVVRSMEINTQKLGTADTDNKFGEFTLPLSSKINITQTIDSLFVRVSRCRRAHLSSYGGKSCMSVQPKPRKAYRINRLCTGSTRNLRISVLDEPETCRETSEYTDLSTLTKVS
jgi:hypothetical protein